MSNATSKEVNECIKLNARAAELREDLKKHNYLYYIMDEPVIGDSQYDEMFKELKDLEEDGKVNVPDDSPTKTVGGNADNTFELIKHNPPMLSLDNVFDETQVMTFLNTFPDGTEFSIEEKLDGIALNLQYINGVLASGSTRGDGSTGENVTMNALSIANIPAKLDTNVTMRVRGETYLPKRAFVELNRQAEELTKTSGKKQRVYVNPRNASAGLMRSKTASRLKGAGLEFRAYVLVEDEAFGSQSKSMDYLDSLGFATVNRFITKDKQAVLKHIEKLNEIRPTIEYDIDGVVLKANLTSVQEEKGFRSRSPIWATSYKFPADKASTVLKAVFYQVGRTGLITPVAEVEPVQVGGVTVTYSTLHNIDDMQRKGIQIGDKVWVERKGDVIPAITGFVESYREDFETEEIEIPELCPCCDSPIEIVVNPPLTPFSEPCRHMYCTGGWKCPDIMTFTLVKMFSRPALNVKGLGESTLRNIVNTMHEKLPVPMDIFHLTVEDLSVTFVPKKAEEVHRMVQSALKGRELYRFYIAMCLPYVGDTGAKNLAKIKRTVGGLIGTHKDILWEVDSFYDKTVEAVYRATRRETPEMASIYKLLEEDSETGKPRLELLLPEEPKDNSFEGKVFCFTGKLTKFTRDEGFSMVEQRSGKPSKSLSKLTTYLVVGENPGSKYDKAISLNVEVLTEDGFLELTK